MICKNVPIGRLGTMQYSSEELKKGNVDVGEKKSLIPVSRTEEELFSPEALASFEGKPVTDEHPPDPDMVDATNYSTYAKGHVQNVRRGTGKDADKMLADLVITDPRLIDDVVNKRRREVSSGYQCLYISKDGGSDIQQSQIRGNHVAVVSKGRAGSSVSIKDSDNTKLKNERSIKILKEDSTLIQKFLNWFAFSVKDAAPDEQEVITKTAADTLEGLTKEKETQNMDEKKDDRYPKRDELLRALKAYLGEEGYTDKGGTEHEPELTEMLSRASRRTWEESKSKDEDSKTDNFSIQDAIQSMDERLKRLETGNKSKDESPAEQEEALTIKADSNDKKADGCGDSKDAMSSLVSALNPVIANISNPTERQTVADSLNGLFFGEQSNVYQNILSAQKTSAMDSAGDLAPITIEERNSIYDKLRLGQ